MVIATARLECLDITRLFPLSLRACEAISTYAKPEAVSSCKTRVFCHAKHSSSCKPHCIVIASLRSNLILSTQQMLINSTKHSISPDKNA